MNFKQAEITEIDQKIKDIFLSKAKKGLFITGKTGVGKTHTLHALRNYTLHQNDTGLAYVQNWVEILFELKDKMNTGGTKEFLYNQVMGTDYIFIDDIGAEKQTDWSQEILYLLINKIYNQRKRLFITTNLTTKEFTEKYGERLTSRLLQMCEVKELEGEDRRIA